MPTEEEIDRVFARWTRVGVFFGCQPADEEPDLEGLLLDTAPSARVHPRLFIMAMSWLHQYGHLVDVTRFRRMLAAEAGDEDRSVLGLLMEWVDSLSAERRFGDCVAACDPAAEAQPLFLIEAELPAARRIVEEHATPLSRKWNMLTRDIELKPSAIRPLSWVLQFNPRLAARAASLPDRRP